jgi:hypothetical protein
LYDDDRQENGVLFEELMYGMCIRADKTGTLPRIEGVMTLEAASIKWWNKD